MFIGFTIKNFSQRNMARAEKIIGRRSLVDNDGLRYTRLEFERIDEYRDEQLS
jgi:hypothetical protein